MGLTARAFQRLPLKVKKGLQKAGIFKIYNLTIANPLKEVDIKGVKYNVDLYTYAGNSLYQLGVYERFTTAIIDDFLKEGDYAVDVGASIGIHALRMAKNVGSKGKVFTFEPSIHLFSDFKKNIELNNFKNIQAENMALYSEEKKSFLPMERLGRLDRKKQDQPLQEVSFTTIDKYFQKVERLDFMKIDTDGAEIEILTGGLKTIRKFKPVITIEVRKKTAFGIYSVLKSLGYSFFDEETLKEMSLSDIEKQAEKSVENILCRCEK